MLSGETDTEDVEAWLEEQGIGEEDEITVCELFDQYERKGRKEGEKRGEARRLVADIENAMKFFQVTLEKACEGLGTTVGRYEEAERMIWGTATTSIAFFMISALFISNTSIFSPPFCDK